MSQPRDGIDEIIEAAKQDLDHVEGKSDAEVRAEHLEKVLEQAIELLLACAAVQGELEQQIDSLLEANRETFQVVLSRSAENAILQRRLDVATRPEISVQLEYVYKGRKSPGTSPLRRRKAEMKPDPKKARRS